MLTKCGVQGMIGCSIIRASLTVALMVSLPRFGSLWAFGPTAHRADASLRAFRTLATLTALVLRHRAWGAAPNPGRREGKRVPCGHLPPEVAKRPGAGQRNHARDRQGVRVIEQPMIPLHPALSLSLPPSRSPPQAPPPSPRRPSAPSPAAGPYPAYPARALPAP